jgi:serine/threonine protein kinase
MNKCPKCGILYDGAEMFCPKDGARLSGREGRKTTIPPEKDPMIGKVVEGRYRIIEQLGEGGMGVVYTAEHVEIEKRVALKVLRDDFSKRPEVVERFRQEARAASKIGHANIVDVTDFGQLEEGGVYFVMEYLEGIGLSELIEEKPIEITRAIPIIRQIAHALMAAHEKGIIHRDLKPENIFLVEREEGRDYVKILDFGIAKISDRDSEGERLTKTGMIFGTPEYMSPEQASGKKTDKRVDIYALGCIMFEMFTGNVPFDGESFMAVLTQHMFEDVPKIEEMNPKTTVTEPVKKVVYKAMAKEASDRYRDMRELEEDLDRALEGISPEGNWGESAGLDSESEKGKPGTEIDWSNTVSVDGKEKRKGLVIASIVVVVFIIAGGITTGIFLGGQGEKGTEGERIDIANEEAEKREDPGDEQEGVDEAVQKEKGQTGFGEEVRIAEKDELEVEIKTVPGRAVVLIEGLGQVCSSTPCKVVLKKGHPVEIEAKKGKAEAKMIFTPSEQNREITMVIEKRKKRIRRRASPEEEVRKRTGKKSTGGLKIPGIFKDD